MTIAIVLACRVYRYLSFVHWGFVIIFNHTVTKGLFCVVQRVISPQGWDLVCRKLADHVGGRNNWIGVVTFRYCVQTCRGERSYASPHRRYGCVINPLWQPPQSYVPAFTCTRPWLWWRCQNDCSLTPRSGNPPPPLVMSQSNGLCFAL